MANYLYNGVELPALPDWDKETYPYALIEYYGENSSNGTTANLYVFDSPVGNKKIQNIGSDSYAIVMAASDGGIFNRMKAQLMTQGEAVSSPTFGGVINSDRTTVTASDLLWANYNVPDYENGGTILAASDPIPVNPPDPLSLVMGYRVGCAIMANRGKVVEHTHAYTATVTDPTCTEKGFTTYSCACGDTYTADEVEALGHEYVDEVIEPTTESEGYTLHTCSRCGHSYMDNYTEKLPQEPELPAVGTSAEDMTWEEIKAIGDAGKASEYFKLGDTKTLTMTDGTTAVMEIVAFDADEKADGSGKAAITWLSKDLIAKRVMNSSDTNANGWAASKMRTWLQSNIYTALPSEVKSSIVTVNKTYYDYTTQSTLTCEDTVWIPSHREVFGNSVNNASLETSGADYTSYFTDNASRIKYYSGDDIYWWLRSATSTGGKRFEIVHYTGASSNNLASQTSTGVALGFCM